MRESDQLIREIEEFSKEVTKDAKFTILTIRNMIESNSRVENSIDKLFESINDFNKQNEALQKRIYLLTIVGVCLALVQAFAVIVQVLNR